ncbi:MAG: calcium-translocating P-type ATPase, PMCA-type [Planctomycetaceae bacterium]|nr:calcium-translocating P-type ATPase, PMCA-type [Planctomycetaceae bacterium]
MSDSASNQPWADDATHLATQLQSDLSAGLSPTEAAHRLQIFGQNRLPVSSRTSAIRLFLGQFADWMVLLLGVAGVISMLIGDMGDAILILLIVVGNGIIGFSQEWKAEKAVEALRQLSEPQVEVVRGGRVHTLPSADLVPGDLIRLRAGAAVPADARVIESAEAEADESALTGESVPVEKNALVVSSETPLADRRCMVHSGSAITRGHVTALITGTGRSTELGRIAHLISTAESGPTPLQQRLARLSRQLAIIVLMACGIIFAAGVFREPFSQWNSKLASDMLLTAVSLAVAAIPEGLPAIVTVALALGSQRMAQRHAIVRKLSAVETLGSVNVICSDKTGTLTQNRMTVVNLLVSSDNGVCDVSDSEQAHAVSAGLLTAAALCNDARVSGNGDIAGSATEAALLVAARTKGLAVEQLQARWEAFHEVPFTSDRKRMSTLHRREDGSTLMLVKGAAERILDRCIRSGELTADTLQLHRRSASFSLDEWTIAAAQLAAEGKRVLGIAARNGPEIGAKFSEAAETDLTLLGLVAIHDPVRPEAANAMSMCHAAGIQTVMITGDHLETARAIAGEVGLMSDNATSISGQDVETLSDEELAKRLKTVRVFARVAPEHKLRIVRAFQSQGAVVAMTGDGVNDAPALKQAEIGVAMGIAGTDVAREAAEMVLADDNFATIVAAVEEGRVVYDNIRRFVAYLLTSNISEILVLFVAVVAGMPLPLLPVQILWINLVTDGLPALALGFEAGEQDVMKRRPRGREPSIFSNGMGKHVLLIGGTMAASVLSVFFMIYRRGDAESLAAARSAVFTCLAFSQLIYVLAVRSWQNTLWSLGFWSNYRLAVAVLLGTVLQLAIIYVPVCHQWFHTCSLSPTQLGLAAGMSMVPFVLAELSKLFSATRSG